MVCAVECVEEEGGGEVEERIGAKKRKVCQGRGSFFFIYMKGPPKTNVGGREGFDRQRMYGEASAQGESRDGCGEESQDPEVC
jgi:hypothetical protein